MVDRQAQQKVDIDLETEPSPGPTTVKEIISTTKQTDPLAFLDLSHPHIPTGETVLAHILYALISSLATSQAQITKTLLSLQAAGYLDLGTLDLSTWEDRTQVLTNGG